MKNGEAATGGEQPAAVVSGAQGGWLSTRWSRLGSGPKMLLVLSLALLPLGLIAIAASVYSARVNSQQRAEQTLDQLDDKAQRLNQLLTRSTDTLRAAGAAITGTAPGDPVCARLLARVSSLQPAPGRYALFGSDGQLRCASSGFAPPAPAMRGPRRDTIEIAPDGESLRLTLRSESGAVEAVAQFSRAALRDLTFIPGASSDFNLELVGDGRTMVLRDDYRGGAMIETLRDAAPIADGRLELRIILGSVPVSALEALMILLPVMMWAAAGLIGWLTVKYQLLTPLAKIQKMVSSYKPGDRPLELPRLKSPAREIGDLGAAFDNVTRTVARHEAELESAVDRQTRLVREVHHRVKNNLQVVASLLNLHSRGSQSEEVAAAYASIQRRVDALAVVHRNHYAELEENRGVALKPLISELAANLRATAPSAAATTQIRLDIGPFYATQDVAVSVAFLVTEIVEFGMLSGARLISIVLDDEDATSARITIDVDSLAGDGSGNVAQAERFERIITGLARQLRSTLDRDPERGRYCLRVAIVGRRQS